ncbi:hypothetical protein HN51_023035 [Arachis hypogaea]|uniref:Auxin-induced protein n=1 Tax=Arachis hypogaea TaxID=3818 RepID=A0A445E739_ARAHY|nr:auxin-responsive protein SAUR36 [Arachis hypogaea]XP_057744521.1 auxin-responsive protein SAUR36 [Arachis stenosperma]RYR71153.1 hypothetical protein Ahy_A02g005451 [Arachis hypogaea]
MRFKLGKRALRVTRWVFRRIKIRPVYQRLDGSSRKPMSKLLNWGRKLTSGAKLLCNSTKIGSGYTRVGADPNPPVPKGYLAVYVGQKDGGEFRRVLVPVVYFNHPLFGELLRESEAEFGYHHPGGITIPCRVTEFEQVKTRIASGSACKRLTWLRHH